MDEDEATDRRRMSQSTARGLQWNPPRQNVTLGIGLGYRGSDANEDIVADATNCGSERLGRDLRNFFTSSSSTSTTSSGEGSSRSGGRRGTNASSDSRRRGRTFPSGNTGRTGGGRTSTPGTDGGGDEYTSVRHPIFDAIQRRLGPTSPNDLVCYLCDKTMEVDEAQLPAEVRELTRFIATKRHATNDKVTFAEHVKGMFEKLIRRPANSTLRRRRVVAPIDGGGDDSDGDDSEDEDDGHQRQEAVPEWTLRSIYTHLTQHDGSMASHLESSLATMTRIERALEHMAYVAKKTDVGSGTTVPETELRVSPVAVAMLLNVVKVKDATVNMINKINESAGDGGGSSSLVPTANRGSGGARSRRTSTSAGSRNANSLTLSSLQRTGGTNVMDQDGGGSRRGLFG